MVSLELLIPRTWYKLPSTYEELTTTLYMSNVNTVPNSQAETAHKSLVW